MATLKYYDSLGASQAYSLIGESGYLPLSGIINGASAYTVSWEDNGSKLFQKFYSGSTLSYSFEYTYASVSNPAPDKRISLINEYNGAGVLLSSWSGLDLSLKELIQKGSMPLLQGEDTIEGNASNNYLQGALGDDVLIGLAGNDTLDGGRADDTLIGGAGNDTLYGGLGTDYAAFSGATSNYTYSFGSDGALTITDKTSADGADKLYDVEWLLFDYGKSTQSKVLVSQLKYSTTAYSLITGYAQTNTSNLVKYPGGSNILVEGNYWTFKSDAHILSWALADNGAYAWPNKETIQDIIGGALEEYSKVANISFQYIGSYASVAAAKSSGADFVYSENDQGTTGSIAYAFFPNFSDKTVYYNFREINARYSGKSFVEFLSFVTIHETGHTLGLKHPHDASALNPVKVYPNSVGDDGLSTLFTVMSYYNPSGFSASTSYWPTTPMYFDDVVLNALYGAPTYRDAIGNTTYSITTENSYQTFVDFSGVNTLDASAASERWYIKLSDGGTEFTVATSLKAAYPNTQTVVGLGNFSNAQGSSYDDAIYGTTGANVINAGDGNDFVWSYGGGDTLDGGYGLDTLVFTENVTDFVISSNTSGGVNFSKGSTLYATTTGFEVYRFGDGTNLNKDITAAQLQSYIVDSPAVITTSIIGTTKEDEQLGLKLSITDADGVGTSTLQWQSKTETGSWVDLVGKTATSLMLTQNEVDQNLRVKVSYIDALGHAQIAYSAATSTVLNVNDLPTGVVTISGKATAGEILTADASLIQDQDGLGTLGYQWQRTANGSKWDSISNATTASYKIVEADAFQSLRVIVSYTDKYNTVESVTAAATGIVNPFNFAATGVPLIDLLGAVPKEDSVMTANMRAVADQDGLGAFSYQWQKLIGSAWVSVPDAKLKTFSPTDAEVGLSLRLKASFVDGRGNLETAYSAASALVQNVNDTPGGGIRLNGSQIEDSTLTAESTLSDDDGIGSLSYQWQTSSNKTTWSNITSATSSSLKLTDAQVGLYVRVIGSYTDGHGTAETATSDASTQIKNINDTPGGAVLVTGVVKEDQTLTASAASVTDDDGLGPISFQWQYASVMGSWIDIAGATTSALVLGDSLVGKSIRATARFADLHGTNEIVASYGTVKVENVNDAPTGSLLIDGKLALGATLSANTSSISDSDGILVLGDGIYDIDAFSYQWQRSSNGTTWGDIAQASSSDYVLVSDDMGQKLRVISSYVDLQGTSEQMSSSATSTVPSVNADPVGAVTLSGVSTEDTTLTVNTTNLSDADGLGALRFQWQRSLDSAVWTNIKSATSVAYTLGDDDVGYFVRAAVIYTDARSTQELVYSAASSAVVGVNDAPNGGVKVTGQFFQGGVVSADVANLYDNDGISEFKYQWQKSLDGIIYTNISAATQKNLELTKFEVDTQIRVVVSYKDGQGFRESLSSSSSQRISNSNDAPVGSLTLTGVPTENKVIALNAADLSDDDGLGAFQYSWQYSNDGEVWSSRPEAFAVSLQLDDQDVGRFLRGVIKYVDGQGNFETVFSQSIGPVSAVNDAPLGDLAINGFLSSGQTLSVDYSDIRDVDGIGAPTFDWYRATSATGTWTKVASSALPSYTLTQSDIGQYVRVDLKYTDKQGFAETITWATDRTILGGVEGRSAGDLVSGTIKDDYISASALDDDINAGAGNDQIDAGKGADVIDAGSGNDAVYLAADGLWAGGFQAARVEYNNAGVSNIAEYLAIDGRNRFFDVVDGNSGFDTIVLADTYNGDAFFLHDFFTDFNSNKTGSFVVDNQGNSGTSRMSGVERILGGQGDDVIDVTSASFSLGDIELQGNQGADVLWGGDGNDILDGGAGTDTLAGGRGNDQFVLRLGEANSSIALADYIVRRQRV